MTAACHGKETAPASAVAVRGGRGGLPLGSSGVREEETVSSLSQTRTAGTVTVADVLLEAGVYLLSRDRRLAVAEAAIVGRSPWVEYTVVPFLLTSTIADWPVGAVTT